MRKFVLTLLTCGLPAAASTGVHPPHVEQRLSFLVNDWTIDGAEATYRENCEWYSERSFVVCNSEDRESGKPVRSVSILGWSAASQELHLSSLRTERAKPLRDVFRQPARRADLSGAAA